MLHNTLKVQRAVHGLTQAELAERIGASRKSIHAIETGQMVPSVLLALKLARVLDVPIETIFMLDGSPVATPSPAELDMEK